MFVDQLKLPNEARLTQILHTLEHVHHFVFESFEHSYLQNLEQQYSAAKTTIVETSAFNSYHANPAYVKASLITEALRLLTEIAPNRRKKNVTESTQHKDPTMTKLNEKAKKAKPDFLDVDHDGDKKESFKKALADKKKAKKNLKEDQNLEQAETLLAAKDLSDQLQDMAEDAAKMAVDRLMPLVDTMKSQFGQPAAEGFNQVVKDNLQKVLDTIIAAKDQTDNAILTLQGGGTPEIAGDISQPLPAEPGAAPDGEEGADIDFDKEFDAMAATSGPEKEPLGRAKKSDLDESRRRIRESSGNAYEMGYNAGVNDRPNRNPFEGKDEFRAGEWEDGYNDGREEAGLDESRRIRESSGNAYEMGYNAGVNDRPNRNPFEGKDEFRAGEWEDGYNDGREEAGLDESRSKCMECGSGMYETHKSGHMICNECGSRMIAEKIEGGVKTHAARAGMFKDWNMGELRSELAKVKKQMAGYKDRDEKVPHKLRTRFSQLTFAIRAKTGWGKVEENTAQSKQHLDDVKAKAAAALLTGKDPETGKPVNKMDAQKILNMKEAKKAKAMELTGDKPPLKKSTIKKAHEIARGVEKNLEEQTSINALNITIRSLSEEFEGLRQQFLLHQDQFKRMVTEGRSIDPLSSGYGLEGAAIMQQMKIVRSRITEAVENRKRIQAELNETALYRRDVRNKIANLDEQLTDNPYGVTATTKEGRRVRKFFESQSHRNMWIDLNRNNLREYQEIDPALIQQIKQKLKNQL